MPLGSSVISRARWTVLVMLGLGGATQAQAALSLEQRVACREKVEDVYWAHRIWPRENRTPKPPREVAVPRSAIARRLEESLRYESALAAIWGTPLSPEAIQAEIDREARSSRDPAMLRELLAALGNDPGLVAECLVRPELAERRIQERYADDRALHASTRRRAERDLAAAPSLAALEGGAGHAATMTWIEEGHGAEGRQAPGTVVLGRDEWRRLQATFAAAFPSATGQADPLAGLLAPPVGLAPARQRTGSPSLGPDSARRTLADLPLDQPSRLREGRDRFYVLWVQERSAWRVRVATVSWPKQSFGEWWKGVREGFAARTPRAGAYRLAAVAGSACAYDTWSIPPGLVQVEPRDGHTALWTGSEMIIWGGYDPYSQSELGNGARYTPGTDTWNAVSTTGAPGQQSKHTAVWTGTEMIVWGGGGLGGRYAPGTDSWVTVNPAGAPAGRSSHTAVWTGEEMIVWGGSNASGPLSSGGIYTPGTDSWTATSAAGAPTPRCGHTAVWTGSAMIVWGGFSGAGFLSPGQALGDGAVYTPATDSWVATTLAGSPAGRYLHTAVWTGSAMIVWGGLNGSGLPGQPFGDGAVYTPATDSWVATSLAGAPSGRSFHTAVWTGSAMIVWGGFEGADLLAPGNCRDDGAVYTAATDSWTATSLTGAPQGRAAHSAVWTGSEMIVWGGSPDGSGYSALDSGGRYDPETESWVATSSGGGGPAPRADHTAVWTGSEMIVWGGLDSNFNLTNSGARYAPATDSWMATSTTGAPVGRDGHGAVWTGSEMIVWGGGAGDVTVTNSGGLYTPGTDSWAATSTTGAPDARTGHAAVWTGSQMIVWGGWNGTAAVSSGSRYTPDTDSWAATSATGVPAPASGPQAVWTGTEMIVWSGSGGGRYLPATDTWMALSTMGAPAPRYQFTALWTGSEMIVWGGGVTLGVVLNTGGRYTPGSDSWAATNTAHAPEARQGHTSVWTGREMIVWGGGDTPESGVGEVQAEANGGGLYCAVVNSVPVANPQSLVVAENGSVPITLTATDPDGDTLTYAIVGNPSHGTLSGAPPAVTYQPTAGYFGLDSFTFQASDGVAGSNVATISLRVDASPVADGQSLTVGENGSLPIVLTATDPDGDTLTYAIVGNPSHGTLSGTPPAVTYLPAAGYFGSDGFTFKANDGHSDSNLAAVTIAVKPAGALLYLVPPCRLFDSRDSTGPLAGGVEEVIQASGKCGVPASALVLAVNVTVVGPTARGFLQLYQELGNAPATSVLNFSAGQVRANNAMVQVSPTGSFVARPAMIGTAGTDLIVDISGYFE